MNELKRFALVLFLVALIGISPAAAADTGAGHWGFFASLEAWLGNLVAEFLGSADEPPAAAAGRTSGDGDEFMGLIIPGG